MLAFRGEEAKALDVLLLGLKKKDQAMALESSPELASWAQSTFASSSLGSLAQSARAKQLRTARNIMIIVGVLTMGFNGLLYSNAHNEVEKVVQKQIKALHDRGLIESQASVAQYRHRITLFCRIIYGSALAVGAVFIGLGIMVYRFPVPATVLGLVLYIGGAAIFGFLSPATLVQVAIFKIIVIVALVKSIHTAISYQRSLEQPA